MIKFKPCLTKEAILTVQGMLSSLPDYFDSNDVYYFMEQGAFEVLVDWERSGAPEDDAMYMAEYYGDNKAFDAELQGYGRVIFMAESVINTHGFPIEKCIPEASFVEPHV